MKKLITLAIAAAMCAFTGCKTPPTVEMMYNTSKSVGLTVAVILNNTTIDDESRGYIIDIANEVVRIVPAPGETFEGRWMAIAETHVQLLLDEEKITQAQADLILAAFKVVVKGIDYVFTRYEKAKNVQELVSAAVDGFADGFLANFKPSNCEGCCEIKGGYNKDAYKYLVGEWQKIKRDIK